MMRSSRQQVVVVAAGLLPGGRSVGRALVEEG